jgi:hypothetical protein
MTGHITISLSPSELHDVVTALSFDAMQWLRGGGERGLRKAEELELLAERLKSHLPGAAPGDWDATTGGPEQDVRSDGAGDDA